MIYNKQKFDKYFPMVLAGFLGYSVYKAIKQKQEGEPIDGGNPQQPQSVPQQASYSDKVKILQRALKVGDDGIAGEQTNGALENLYSKDGVAKTPKDSASKGYPNLNNNGFGVVSSANVDKYIDAIAKTSYPLAIYKQNISLLQDADGIRSAYEKGGFLRVRGTKTFSAVVKDASRNVWVTTGKTYTYSSGATFVYPEFTSRGYVKIVDKTKSNRLIVKVSTLTTTYWLSCLPSDLYVTN